MVIKYGDIVKAVKKHKRNLLIVGTFLDVLGCAAAAAGTDGGRFTEAIALVIGIGVFIALLLNYLTAGKRLEKMWANVGSPDTDEINQMLGRAVSLNGDSVMKLLTDKMVLNFDNLHAYRLTDITRLYKTTDTDDEGSVTGYNAVAVCSGYPFKKDSLSFSKESERDAAFDMILQAYGQAGGMDKITEN